MNKTENQPDIISEASFNHFGIKYPFPYQRLVIDALLRGTGYYGKEEMEESIKERIVILPTGAGKSLCFMLPIFLIKGITVVIFPLLSLMSDQLRRCEEAGINAKVLKGGMSLAEKNTLFNDIKKWERGMILTNMETLLSGDSCTKLAKLSIVHLVFDEVHTLFEWGDTFRPALQEGEKIIEQLNATMVTAFTATASPKGVARVIEILFPQKNPVIVNTNPDRTNISYHILPIYSFSKTIVSIFGSNRVGLDSRLPKVERPAVIFFRNRMDVEKSVAILKKAIKGIDIFGYHAGMDTKRKKEIEDGFFKSKNGILCSTNAYGMGVDKKNIRTVIHAGVPPTVESYLQESGRAGRDRTPAQAWLFIRPSDFFFKIGKKGFTGDNITPALKLYALQQKRCRREILMEAMDKECTNCTGCDICNKSVLKIRENPKKFETVLKTLTRQYPLKLRAKILKGIKNSQLASFGPIKPIGWGILKKWNLVEIEELLEQFDILEAYKKKKIFSSNFNVDKRLIDCFN